MNLGYLNETPTKRVYNSNTATATPGNVISLNFDSTWDGYTVTGIITWFIGNRGLTIYHLNTSLMQLQNTSSSNQTVNAGDAYIDFVYKRNIQS